MVHAEGGCYFLFGSSLSQQANYNDEPVNSVDNLSASAIGGLLTAGMEWKTNQNMALNLALGYRFLAFDNIQYAQTLAYGALTSSSSGTLTGYNGNNATIDFSGFNLSIGARFY
jgi:hypothetical protein